MAPSKTVINNQEELFSDEIVRENIRLSIHRKNSRLYYMNIPSDTKEMIYVENFLETHWLKKACFIRENVPWPSLEFVREGSLLVKTEEWDVPQIVEAGQLLWIPSGCKAALKPGPEEFCRKVSIMLSGPLLPAWQKASGFDHSKILSGIDRKQFELHLEKLRYLCGKVSGMNENGLAAWSLLQFLQSPVPGPDIPDKFLKLREKIISDPGKNYTLDELSREAHCTKIHLIRAFNHYFGESPHRMLRKTRMNFAAAVLLQHLDLSIKEIAARAGYENALTFSSEFKRCYGESPKNYRKRALNIQQKTEEAKR